MKKLGTHVLAEFADCDRRLLDCKRDLEAHMVEAVGRSGATLIRSVFHEYVPQGVSGVLVIAESHFSIHTWPEYGYAAADFFTCGSQIDPMRACDYLGEALSAGEKQICEIPRGIPSPTPELLPHKKLDPG